MLPRIFFFWEWQVLFIYQFFAWIAWIKRQGREVWKYCLAVAYWVTDMKSRIEHALELLWLGFMFSQNGRLCTKMSYNIEGENESSMMDEWSAIGMILKHLLALGFLCFPEVLLSSNIKLMLIVRRINLCWVESKLIRDETEQLGSYGLFFPVESLWLKSSETILVESFASKDAWWSVDCCAIGQIDGIYKVSGLHLVIIEVH